MATWRDLFDEAYKATSDEGDVLAVAPSDSVLDVEFDDNYGTSNGPKVLIWTDAFVYFPVVYDGKEWLGSASRDPSPTGQGHVGGE